MKEKDLQERDYLEQEFRESKRILTMTVVLEQTPTARLPVRTAKVFPKKDLFKAMEQIARVSVKPPVKIGEVVEADLAGSGVDLIAADDLLR